jgi:hypothetical protein
MSTGTEKKPSIETQAPQTYLQVEAGIYRYKDKEGNVTYHERPSINGTRTYRSLGYNFTAQHNIKLAREEYHKRRIALSKGENPYAEPGALSLAMWPTCPPSAFFSDSLLASLTLFCILLTNP